MKSNKFFLTSATVFFTAMMILLNLQNCEAQYYEITLEEKVQKSEWIVEGEITESISYEAEGNVFTCHKLNVLNSIFPLESPCNNALESKGYCVYVITRGGETEEVIENWSHALKFAEGERGLFYLSITSRPVLYTDAPSYEAYAGPQGFIHYGLDDIANFHGNEIFHSYSNPETEIIQPIYDVLDTMVNKESFVRNEWELWYLLDNVQLNGNQITFDVRLKAAWGNAFKIKDLSLRLKHDTTFFGKNLLLTGNINFTLDSELSQSGIALSSSQLFDDELAINFFNNTPANGEFIGESHQKLLTVQLTLQGFNFQEIPYFEIMTEGGGTIQTIFDDGLNEVIPDKTKLVTDLGEFSLCGGINNVMPLEVGAGIQEQNSLVFDANPYAGIITITGFDFDDLDEANLAANIPNDYRVEFESIIGGVIRVTPFVSDYILWDDEEIRVRVPSIGYRVDGNILNLNPEWLAAATGRVRVVTPAATCVSPADLVVEFVHWNAHVGDNVNNHEAVRLRLKALDHFTSQINNDGYEFFFTENFIDNMPNGSQAAVQGALNTWCPARANFEIVAENAIEEPDFAGTIDWGALPAGFVADSRQIVENNLIACEENDAPVRSLGIIFSSAVDFATDMDPGDFDVESVALHELGHNHTLGHVSNANHVMHGVVADMDRDLDDADNSGGQHVVNASSVQVDCPIGGNNIVLSPMIPLGPCVNSTFDLSENFRVKIFPNPTNNSFELESEDEEIAEVAIFDVSGKLVFVESNIHSQNYLFDNRLDSGMYFFKVTFKNQFQFTQKLIVTK